MVSITNAAIVVIVSLFTLITIFILAINIIGVNLLPLIKGLDQSGGIPSQQYNTSADRMWTGIKIFFYIILVIPVFFFGMKLLYEREETSVQVGG